ncbi:hypothetical protein T07_2280 [Trichinella nelsoni]|uniref:Uncharacterized protein n=1 Tax=Trichinella nelsoni TaxID=6336 RepID=A0A0V0RSI1_9BILA|nr:hypothetical protein T07_2280 [Trichinella nelsoni]
MKGPSWQRGMRYLGSHASGKRSALPERHVKPEARDRRGSNRFQAGDHRHEDLDDATKFTYLLSSLSGEAATAIEGMPNSGANYPHAVELLRTRFGRTDVIIRERAPRTPMHDRPLTFVGNDAQEELALTTAHFLIDRSLVIFLDWRDRTSQHSRWGKKPPSRWRMFRTKQLRYCSPEPVEPKFRLTKSLRCLTTQGIVPACTAERMGPGGVIRVWQRGRPAEVHVFCSVAGGQAESQRLRGGEHGNYVVASCLFDSGSEGSPRAATGKGRLPAVTRRRVWPSSVKTPRENIGYPAGLRKDPATCRRPTELAALGRYPATVRRGQTGGPVAVETLFIWVVCGRTSPLPTGKLASPLKKIEDSADATLRKFWEIEALGFTPEEDVSAMDAEALKKFEETLTFEGEKHRLMAVERRLKGHRQLNTAYTSAIRQYFENGGSKRHPKIARRNGIGISCTTRSTRAEVTEGNAASCSTAHRVAEGRY